VARAMLTNTGSGGIVWVIYIIVFIVVTNIALLNLVTGVIVDSVMAAAAREARGSDTFAYLQDEGIFKERMRRLFDILDMDGTGKLDYEEYRLIMCLKEAKEAFEAFDISTTVDFADMFAIIDVDESGTLEFQEFIDGCQRLRGSLSNGAVHSLFVHSDLFRCRRTIMAELDAMERDMEGLSAQQAARTAEGALGSSKLQEEVEQLLTDLHSRIDALGISVTDQASVLGEVLDSVEALGDRCEELETVLGMEDGVPDETAALQTLRTSLGG